MPDKQEREAPVLGQNAREYGLGGQDVLSTGADEQRDKNRDQTLQQFR